MAVAARCSWRDARAISWSRWPRTTRRIRRRPLRLPAPVADARIHAHGHPIGPAGLARHGGPARRARAHARARRAGSPTVVGEGEVVATVPKASQIVLEHGEIKGFMEAMTMGYRIDPASLLAGLKPRRQGPFHDRCAAPGDRRHREAAVETIGSRRMASAKASAGWMCSARWAHRLRVGEPRRRVSRRQRGGRGARRDEDRVEPGHRARQRGRRAAPVAAAGGS